MQCLWVSLKDNVKCGNKLTDVIRHPAKCGKGSSYVPENMKINIEEDNSLLMETPPPSFQVSRPRNRPSNTLPQLHELVIGDPSRKIVEMIFQKAWMNNSKPLRKVKTVLKVSYSAQVLERFEKYREKVKKNACEQCPRHPRSIVDGNELLRFYVTTMKCFQGKPVKKVPDLCKDPSCRFCQIIRFSFNSESTKIQLKTSEKYFTNRTSGDVRVKNVKRAAIVCRIIAGTAVNEVDGEYEEGSHSTNLGEMQLSLERFVEKNPSSILPCFVIIFT